MGQVAQSGKYNGATMNDKPCINCGGTERYKPKKGRPLGNCKACHKARAAKWIAENHEKALAGSAKWKADNPEKVKAYRTKYYAENSEKDKARLAKYYAENRDKTKAARAKWQRDNPGKVSAIRSRRRARKLNAEGDHTAEDWLAILDHYGNACLACGSTENIHKDHIVALANGGTNWASNLQPLCGSCNCSKHTNTIDYRPDSGIEFWRQGQLELDGAIIWD